MAKISIERLGLGKGKGLLSRMRAIIDRHSDFIEYTVGVGGITVSQNARGGITIRYSGGGGDRLADTWSGFLLYLGAPWKDFTRVGGALDGDLYSAMDTPKNWVTEEVAGLYLKVKIEDGSAEFVDAPATPSDYLDYAYFRVANKNAEGVYSLAIGRTVGDARVDYAPFFSPVELEE